MQAPFGFLGYGEAAFHLSRGLRDAGAPPLVAYDIASGADDAIGARIRERAAETETTLVASPAELAAGARIILSVVTANAALDAAGRIASELDATQLFVDLNSVSPDAKRQMAAIVTEGAAGVIEGAIMAPVPGLGHRVPILVNGPRVPELLKAAAPYDMRLDEIPGEIGAAAAVKMCRSVVIKGMEALLLECSLVAREYGVTERVFASLADTYPGLDWSTTAEYMIGRVLLHGARRAREMEEVAHTLRAAGIEPLMAEATARRQDWEAQVRADGRLQGERPGTPEELLDLFAKKV